MWVQGGEKEQLAKTGFGILASVKYFFLELSDALDQPQIPFWATIKEWLWTTTFYEKCNTALSKETPSVWAWHVYTVSTDSFLQFDQIDLLGGAQSDRMKRNKMRRDAKSTDLWPSHTPHILTGQPKVYTIHIFEITFPELSMSCVSCWWWAALCPVSWCCLWGAAETLECSESGSGL